VRPESSSVTLSGDRIGAYLPVEEELPSDVTRSLFALASLSDGWTWRRVETFRFVDSSTAEREILVDLEIPAGTPYVIRAGRAMQAIPLGFFERKLALGNFSVRDETGARVVHLTSRENIRNRRAFFAHAIDNDTLRRELGLDRSDSLEKTHSLLDPPHSKDVDDDARKLCKFMQHGLERLPPDRADVEAHRRLLELFLSDYGRAYLLVGLLPVEGPRRRTLTVRLDCQVRRRPKRSWQPPRDWPSRSRARLAKMMSYGEMHVHWKVWSLGDAISGHYEIEAPPEVEISAAFLVPRSTDGSEGSASPVDLGHRAHLFARPPNTPERGSAWGRGQCTELAAVLRPRAAGLSLAGFALTCLLFAILALGSLVAGVDSVARNADAAVTLLVVAPTLGAAFLLRPNEHEIATRLLVGLRVLVAITGSLALTAAVSLLLVDCPAANACRPSRAVTWLWNAEACAAALLAMLFFSSWIRARRSVRVEKTTQMPRESLVTHDLNTADGRRAPTRLDARDRFDLFRMWLVPGGPSEPPDQCGVEGDARLVEQPAQDRSHPWLQILRILGVILRGQRDPQP
jgi:hypothetical protein